MKFKKLIEKINPVTAAKNATVNFKANSHGISKRFMDNEMTNPLTRRSNQFYADSSAKDYCDAYVTNLVNGEVKYNPFVKGERKMFYFVDGVINGKAGSREYEDNLICFEGFINTLHRQLAGYPFKKSKYTEDESKEAEKIRNAWENATLFGKRNILKEAAWIATHAYLMGIFFIESNGTYSDGKITNMIPKTEAAREKWNEYINTQEDVPQAVKDIFIIPETGVSQYEQNHPRFIPAPKDVAAESPSDDIPDDGDNVEGHTMEAKVEAANKELDKQFQAAMDRDTSKEEKKASKEVNPEVKAEKTEKDSSFKPIKDNFGTPITAVPQDKVPPVKDLADMDQYDLNNDFWETRVHKLDRFTKKVEEIKRAVIYSSNPNGMITAQIVDKNTNQVYNKLLIDPYLRYGDTIRVLYYFPNGRVCYIPISQDGLIAKAIRGTFTEEDANKVDENLPEAITRGKFFDKYTIFDVVDFRDLNTQDFGRGMPFKDWKVLVNNIGNILSNEHAHTARYRVTDVINKDNFKLVADQQAMFCTYQTPIWNDQTAILNNQRGILINYTDGQMTIQ